MITPNTNRIVEEQAIRRVREVVAPNINIHWNPENNDGVVMFGLQDQVWENDVYVGLQPHTRLRSDAASSSMLVMIPELLERTFLFNGEETPAAVLMLMIKALFDQIWNERYEAQLIKDSKPPDDEPEPEEPVEPEPEEPVDPAP